MKRDICYYSTDVLKVGIRKGRHVDDRPAGSSWQTGETTGSLSVLRNAEVSQDDLDMLRGWKWLLSPVSGKKGEWTYKWSLQADWRVHPDTVEE